MKGSTSAKKTDDGIAVTCWCGQQFVVPVPKTSAEPSTHTCACGAVYRYDGTGITVRPKVVNIDAQ